MRLRSFILAFTAAHSAFLALTPRRPLPSSFVTLDDTASPRRVSMTLRLGFDDDMF